MNRPRATREQVMSQVISIMTKNKVYETVILVGIRGYYKSTMGDPDQNDRGIYDDAIFVISPRKFISFNGNTDPSIYRCGIATLIPGVHYYKKGKHGLSKPGGGYAALRPDTPDESLPVKRDDWCEPKKGIAINIHRGGYKTTSSEGCQTIHPDQWTEFINAVYREMDMEGQRRIPYILIEN